MSKRRVHSDEFKREAVKLVTEGGYTNAEAARSLGIHANLLRSWRRKQEAQQNGVQSMTETEEEELRRRREEVRRLRMERDILKKATVFFANERH